MDDTIVFVTSEAAPLVKTGGLADVCGSLPGELTERGRDTAIILPWFEPIDGEIIDTTMMSLSGREIKVTLGKTTIDDVPVRLIGHPPMFHRDGFYDDHGRPYPDNDRRFILFSKAAIWAAEREFEPALYHCHDWFTGAVPMLLNHDDHQPDRPVLFTIHNLRHQGVFPAESYRYLELPWEQFRFDTLEYHGQLNLMKAGITQADRLTTVSPTYSEEIQTEQFGEGLQEALADRSGDLSGVLNGIDTETWNPATDQYLENDERFSVDDLEGKSRVKSSLLDRFNGSTDGDQPLIGMVGRLVEQKGIDLLLEGWEELKQLSARWVILGTGDANLEERLRSLSESHPDRIHTIIDFSEPLAHRIEAGSDMFCMPSRYEPCGLNQMYSMQYGTVPIVHATGGLADTVTDPEDDPDNATGFTFDSPEPDELVKTVRRAVNCFRDQPDTWGRLRENGMTRDWSWGASAKQYDDLYEEMLS